MDDDDDADIDTDPAATLRLKPLELHLRQVNEIFFKRPKCGLKRDHHCMMIEDISLLLLVLILDICIALK